ncbi:MAG: hypothetical protein M0Z93_08490 [Actinomycetota bacterium]|nr:hypothetical protein [Actinomycetota bacterium]
MKAVNALADSVASNEASATPVPTPVAGCWEVAADGGIFTFGDASFYGSMGATPRSKHVVGITVE